MGKRTYPKGRSSGDYSNFLARRMGLRNHWDYQVLRIFENDPDRGPGHLVKRGRQKRFEEDIKLTSPEGIFNGAIYVGPAFRSLGKDELNRYEEELAIKDSVHSALKKLRRQRPERYRPIAYRFFRGLSWKEIAKKEDKTISTVFFRMKEGLKNLREILSLGGFD